MNIFMKVTKVKKLLVYSRSKEIEHDRLTFVNDDPKTFLENYQTEKNIWFLGDSGIIEIFQNTSLIDKYIISIIQSLIGNGIPLFKHGIFEKQLELIKTQSFDVGIVNLHYKKV